MYGGIQNPIYMQGTILYPVIISVHTKLYIEISLLPHLCYIDSQGTVRLLLTQGRHSLMDIIETSLALAK